RSGHQCEYRPARDQHRPDPGAVFSERPVLPRPFWSPREATASAAFRGARRSRPSPLLPAVRNGGPAADGRGLPRGVSGRTPRAVGALRLERLRADADGIERIHHGGLTMNDCGCDRRSFIRSLAAGSALLPGLVAQLLADDARTSDDPLAP